MKSSNGDDFAGQGAAGESAPDPFGLAGIPGIDSPIPTHQNADALNDLPGVFDAEGAGAPPASGEDALAMPPPPDLAGGHDPFALPPTYDPAPGAGGTSAAIGDAPGKTSAAIPGSAGAGATAAKDASAPSSTSDRRNAASSANAPAKADGQTPATSGAGSNSASSVNTPDAMGKIKEFSEKIGATPAAVAAAFPFSLMIEGHLDDYEREKLTDILSRENMGILESDLVPQFASDKILLPRISEYAGTLIIQSLRSANVRMRLGPSDEIFATDETRTGPGELGLSETSHSADNVMYATPGGAGHPAENIPLTDESKMPGLAHYTVVDVLTASALLQTTQVEAQRSTEYQEILEGLQREIKYKAYHKGATAVLRFAVQLVPLILPTSYRLMVTGLAVRDKDKKAPVSPDTDLP